jgi:GH35 family endo-1,4-beta-xylanase
MRSRRSILKTTVAMTLAAPIFTRAEDRTLRLTIVETDGSQLARERLRLLIARDLVGDPLPVEITGSRAALTSEPIQFTVPLNVPGFGEVYCAADNDGKGYTTAGEIDFVSDAAATRLRRVREAFDAARASNLPTDPEFDRHLEQAAKSLPGSGPARTAAAYEALSHGLHAGERLALNLARQRIARLNGPRQGFLFSALASQFQRGGAYVEHLKALCNFAPTNWYSWKDENPPAARIDYGRMDQSVDWMLANHIAPKIFGYCYMARGATATWMRPEETPAARSANPDAADAALRRKFNPRWPYDRIRAEYQRVITQTVARYRGRAKYVEVINEAHDKSNLWDLNHDQIVEMTRLSCQAASGMRRVINNCCLWAEYAKRANPDGSRRWSPYRYLQECLNAGAELEIVGVQLYYPQYDLFEIDRMLDRMITLGKPIHVTEMATASHEGLDAESMRPRTSAPGWHGPWTETTQADWAEAMYTLCYSKPQIEAIGWWDLADVPGHFWPFGGLLHEDMTPKESYLRLRKLQQSWGFK